MREILFKGKRADNGNWIEGQLAYFFDDKETPYIMPKCYFATREMGEDENDETIISNEICFGGFISVNPETVCQFTGEVDKDGDKIFEGDICESSYYNTPLAYSKEKPSYTTVEQVVIFSIGSFLLQNTVLHNDFEKDIRNHTDLHYIKSTLEIEVIGNIHD